MKLEFEYGDKKIQANLPENTDVFIQDTEDNSALPINKIVEETKKSILNPIGCKPIKDQVKEGSKVVIIFSDKINGGIHATAHRKIAIPIVIDQCLKAGVLKKDIKLICSNGLHRKKSKTELKSL